MRYLNDKDWAAYLKDLKKMSPLEALDLIYTRYEHSLEREGWEFGEQDAIAFDVVRKALAKLSK